jgi:hypothetical protein
MTGSHGSTNEVMIRDGRLEGVMPTSDCGYTPRTGFGFTYLVEDTGAGGYPWVTSDGATQWTSIGAIFRNDPSGVHYNCACHGSGSAYYAMTPPGTGYDASAFKTIYAGYHVGPISGPIDATLVVDGTPWTAGELVGKGFFVNNFSDGSRGQIITANTENTVTVSGLEDGQENMWHNGDAAYIYDYYGYDRSYLEYYRPYWDPQVPPPSTRYLIVTARGDHNGTAYTGERLYQMCTLLGFPEPGVTTSPDGGAYDYGTEVTLTAVPGDGWNFTGWAGGLTGTENPTSVTMDAHMRVTANFARAD